MGIFRRQFLSLSPCRCSQRVLLVVRSFNQTLEPVNNMHIETEQLDLEKVGKDKYELKFECINEEYQIVKIMKRLRERSNNNPIESESNLQDTGLKELKSVSNCHGKSLENSPIVSGNLRKRMHRAGSLYSEMNYNSQLCSMISPLKISKDILPFDLLSQHTSAGNLPSQEPQTIKTNEGGSNAMVDDCLHKNEHSSQQIDSGAQIASSLHERPIQVQNSIFSQCNKISVNHSVGQLNLQSKSSSQLEEEFLSLESQELLWNQSDSDDTSKMVILNSVGNSFPDLSQSTLMELDCVMDSFESKPARCDTYNSIPALSQENPFVENFLSVGFTTAAGNKVNIKTESVVAAQRLLHDLQESQSIPNEQEKKHYEVLPKEDPFFQGFTTAAGKKVNINAAALAKASSILGMSEEINQNRQAESTIFTKKNDINGMERQNQHAEMDDSFHQEIIQDIKQDFCGFSTAAGKKITVCKESIKKATKLIDKGQPTFSVHNDNSNFDFACGFSTAAGSKVAISAKSIKKAMGILQDTNQQIGQQHCIEKESKQSFDDIKESYTKTEHLLDKENIDPNLPIHHLNLKERTQVKRGKFIETKKNPSNESVKIKSGIMNPQFIPPKLRPIKLEKTEIKIVKPKLKIVFDLGILKNPIPTLKSFIKRAKQSGSKVNNSCERNQNALPFFKEIPTELFNIDPLFQKSFCNKQLSLFSLSDFSDNFSQLIPECSVEWIKNHSSLLFWKYNSLQMKFPDLFNFSTSDIFIELLYRYQIEHLEGKRSIVKMIAEKDESPSLNMTLVVYDIIYDEQLTLVLSDGWYFIRAKIDEPLSWLVLQKKIYVGVKLSIYGAHLESSSFDGVSVLESFDKISLKIFANSTKPAPPFAKLGLNKYFCFAVSLDHVFPDGGVIPCLDVVVQRKYSLSYMKSGVSITSNEYHRFIEKIQQSFYSLQSKEGQSYTDSVQSHNSIDDSYEKYQQELKTMTCLFKFKIANYSDNNIGSANEATFTFWRPNQEIFEMIKEGSRIRIFNSRATSNYQGSLSISNTTSTMIEVKRAEETILDKCFSPRSIVTDFSLIKQGFECDIRVSVKSIMTNRKEENISSPSSLHVTDSIGNCGIINLTNNLILFFENRNYLIRNAYLNFYDQNTKTFIFSLSDLTVVVIVE